MRNMEKISADLAVRVVRERCVKSFLDVIIASMLIEKASWGYEIIANIHEKLHILLSPGAIYPVLYSMEKKGIIKKHEENKKKFYSITKKGVEWVNQMLDASKYLYDIVTVFKNQNEKEKMLQFSFNHSRKQNYNKNIPQMINIDSFEN